MVWLPAYAAAGDWLDLGVVMAVGAAMLAGAVRFCAPRFGRLALAAASIGGGAPRSARWRSGFRRLGFRRSGFRPRSPGHALRSKEWVLLRRDPWLMSQSLMQILYLLPPFFMLWRTFYGDSDGVTCPREHRRCARQQISAGRHIRNALLYMHCALELYEAVELGLEVGGGHLEAPYSKQRVIVACAAEREFLDQPGVRPARAVHRGARRQGIAAADPFRRPPKRRSERCISSGTGRVSW
jgi:hypothetical protein